MRIPRKFGERTTHFEKTQNEKRKYILAYEGQATEVQYFQGVIDNRSTIGIDPIIDLLPVLRSIPQESHSHPKRILHLLEDHIDNYDSVGMLVDKIIDYSSENDLFDKSDEYSLRSFEEDLRDCIQIKCNLSLDDKIKDKNQIITELVNYIEDKLDLTEQVDKITTYIEQQQILYIEGLDHICLIIDRDKGNIKTEQYQKIVERCKEKKIRLFVTNPAFEFWLLLHSEKVFDYERDELLINYKAGRKRFLERILSEVFDGYSKGKINVDRFLPHIHDAIEREKCFCEDVTGLQENLGSNVGLLLSEFMPDE